jgi:hypothetical protein
VLANALRHAVGKVVGQRQPLSGTVVLSPQGFAEKLVFVIHRSCVLR